MGLGLGLGLGLGSELVGRVRAGSCSGTSRDLLALAAAAVAAAAVAAAASAAAAAFPLYTAEALTRDVRASSCGAPTRSLRLSSFRSIDPEPSTSQPAKSAPIASWSKSKPSAGLGLELGLGLGLS